MRDGSQSGSLLRPFPRVALTGKKTSGTTGSPSLASANSTSSQPWPPGEPSADLREGSEKGDGERAQWPRQPSEHRR